MKLNLACVQLILVSMLLVAGGVLYFQYPAYVSIFYPSCIFYRLTGLFCPGCGSQRAGSALLHGRLLAAADYNLLFVLCLPLVGYSALAFTWSLFSRNKLSQRLFYSSSFVKSLLALVLLFAILRNLPLEPFRWLSPNN